MTLRETISLALAALAANRLRSILTMLGIVIGIAAVITVVGLGVGAQRAVDARMSSLGTTLLQVSPERQRRGGVQWGDIKRLTIADAAYMDEHGQHFAAVQPEQTRDLQVVYDDRNTSARIVSTTANFLGVRGFQLAAGRMFTTGEDRGAQRVAVLGATVVSELGYSMPQALVGQRVRIAGRQFHVIGVLAPRGRTMGGGDPDNQVIVPLHTGRYRLFGTDRLNDIFVLARDEASLPLATDEIRAALRRSHRIHDDQPDDFRIRNQTAFLAAAASTTEVFTYLLAGIAAVSLLVGGIGIMNIMLVSVTERTREIGIRKALGATRRVILLQFLTEAVFTSLAGGVAGIIAGCGALIVAREGMAVNAAIPTLAIAGAVLFAALVGIVFGVWPARRAATLDPIVALRYE